MTGSETAAWTAGIVEDGPPQFTRPVAGEPRPEPSQEAA